MKQFVAISTEIYDGKLVLINTSVDGKFLRSDDGITYKQAIDFLFSLNSLRKRTAGVVFVCYAFSADNEFIFSTLPASERDKLFQSHQVKQTLAELENEQENIEEQFYNAENDTQNFEQLDFERYVNKIVLSDLKVVYTDGYKIELANGKRLTITKNRKSFVLYDIYGFFQKSLYSCVKTWFEQDLPILRREVFNTMPQLCADLVEHLKTYSDIETFWVSELATKLNNELNAIGIRLQRFHGASAISSNILTNSKAKTEFYNYRYKRQLSPELWRASRQAYYGGRVEQFKIGTFNDVYVYDINSAYAYAATMLPVMLRKPLFKRQYEHAPFSLWFCEYDFRNLDCYFGLLPNRETRGNATRYRLRGKGYFYQPEISYILQHYPECIDIKKGFVLPYQRANFTDAIEILYQLRLQLIADHNPLEKVIKLALSSIYGKFCQHNGKGHFYNFFYAGFITSLTRRQLLEATRGKERSTICFLTDAIHTTEQLDVPVNDEIGAYKLKHITRGAYLESGIYRHYDEQGGVIKTATRGYRTFNFDKALNELADKKLFLALQEFFVSHNLHALRPVEFNNYLGMYSQEKKETPYKSAMRVYDACGVDLRTGFIDSKPLDVYGGRESGLYKEIEYKETDAALDTINAGRFWGWNDYTVWTGGIQRH